MFELLSKKFHHYGGVVVTYFESTNCSSNIPILLFAEALLKSSTTKALKTCGL